MTVGDDKKRVGLHHSWLKNKPLRQTDSLRIKLVNMCYGIPCTFKRFPNLKTLAICYPNQAEGIEAELLKKVFLVKFPNLEYLQLLHFRRVCGYSHWTRFEVKPAVKTKPRVISASEKVRAQEFLQAQNYWEVCPKLKMITVVIDGNYDIPSHVVFQETR